MPDLSATYGVRKLVAINSGKFSFAELDLTAPVHLAAPNNRGKSTLVNALQFLYVDEFRVMRFGKRDDRDTRQHYFGQNPSYLIFECMTPLGVKCMLVAGQGPLSSFEFSRIVYEGAFDMKLFLDDDQCVLPLEQLRPRLAGLVPGEVRPGNLWEVLGDPRQRGDNAALPRLNILPVRTRDEYNSFRGAFIRLLALSNVSARELRELIIDCHARDLSCRRIDVAGEHREDFDRADHAERALRFTEAAQMEITSGVEMRQTVIASVKQLQAETPSAARDAGRLIGMLGRLVSALDSGRKNIDGQRADLTRAINDRHGERGGLEAEQKAKQKELDNLLALHERWQHCTADMVQTMMDNQSALQREIVQLESDLGRSKRISAESLRRRVQQLERDIHSKQRLLAHWDERATHALRGIGLMQDEVREVFRLLNPQLLELVVGKDIQVLDTDLLRHELQAIVAGIHDGQYRDQGVAVMLERLGAANLTDQTTREEMSADVKAMEEDLRLAREQLKVAVDQAAAERLLAEKRGEASMLGQRLMEYESYARQWAGKADVDEHLRRIIQQLEQVKATIEELNVRQGALACQEKQLADTQREAAHQREQLRTRMESLWHDCEQARIDVSPAQTEGVDDDDAALTDPGMLDPASAWESLRARINPFIERITRMCDRVRVVRNHCDEIERLQKQITAHSRRFERQEVYFSDADADWDRLAQLAESVGEQRRVVDQAWNSLFTRISAKLNEIRLGVAAIRGAIHRINAGLADYRVSNLRSVKLEVVPQQETFGMIETLTNAGGIFQDHEKLDLAKGHMRHWISENKVIQLEELFAIHIKVHDLDKERPTEARSLDEIGSTGTGMTAKAMIFIQLVRAVVGDQRYRLHFFLDETGQLDDRNLAATTSMAVARGVMPITADPDVRIEPLAHPTVTVYVLGQERNGHFVIDGQRTCHARRTTGEPGEES